MFVNSKRMSRFILGIFFTKLRHSNLNMMILQSVFYLALKQLQRVKAKLFPFNYNKFNRYVVLSECKFF